MAKKDKITVRVLSKEGWHSAQADSVSEAIEKAKQKAKKKAARSLAAKK